MSISVTCPACRKTFQAKESLAGKSGPCPSCKQMLTVPKPEEDAAAFLLQADPPAQAAPTELEDDGYELIEPEQEPQPVRRRKQDVMTLPPLTAGDPPVWLRHLHWLLVLALAPLALSLLHSTSTEEDLKSRLIRALEHAPKDVQEKADQILEDREGSLEDLLEILPGQRLEGAFLPRHTHWHWLFAVCSSVLFLSFFVFLASDNIREIRYVLGAALFTATIGIFFLLVVQAMAFASEGVMITGRGALILVFYVVKLIGFSYRAALDPGNGFLVSALGFTLGVGFCEEVCKAVPLFWFSRGSRKVGWRSLFLWGLASGAGFGIAEGVIYSGDSYNGIMGSGIYVVRFLSCVALHAVWTSSVGVTLYQQRGLFEQVENLFGYIPPLFVIVGVPMILHGLYDTLLKKEMNALALAVAMLSFLYLAFQISRRNVVDDKARTRAMLREYKKRREAMA